MTNLLQKKSTKSRPDFFLAKKPNFDHTTPSDLRRAVAQICREDAIMRKITFCERLWIHIRTAGSLKAMLPWSRNWLSSAVKGDPEVKDALDDLSQLIRDYGDAAKPQRCRGPAKRFFSAEIDFFMPGIVKIKDTLGY